MTDTVLLSLDHDALLNRLAADERLLLIQDLDGVCMGLVRDPLQRVIDPRYVEAAARLDGHFYVLTNGEFIGGCGVNGVVERAFASPEVVRERGCYLPGLAAGGVQFQTRRGAVTHPGVSQAELAFLATIPDKAHAFLSRCLSAAPWRLSGTEIDTLLAPSILDNRVSPTVNLNQLYPRLRARLEDYRHLQQQLAGFLREQLQAAARQGLKSSFFVHLAPNLGTDSAGDERLIPADDDGPGTHDFQFMLTGAVKEAGVLVLLNHYYHRLTGRYPLGEGFNARQAPRGQAALLELAAESFDPACMPRIVGVGDTVTAQQQDGQTQRGGSDRGFLTLVQALGRRFNTDNVAVFVDSSGGEVPRCGIDADALLSATTMPDRYAALRGITDDDDPLRLNVVFPGGHRQYVAFMLKLAARFAGGTHFPSQGQKR